MTQGSLWNDGGAERIKWFKIKLLIWANKHKDVIVSRSIVFHVLSLSFIFLMPSITLPSNYDQGNRKDGGPIVPLSTKVLRTNACSPLRGRV